MSDTNHPQRVFLVAGKRTPFGKFGGSLKGKTPVELAVIASEKLVESSGINPKQIDHVILGNVVPSSTDTMYAGRHVALKLGCRTETPGYNVNRLCGSGIQAIMDGVRLIKLNEARCVLAVGVENMSMVPHLTYGGRFGTKYGSLKNVDMLLDALTDKHAGLPMGATAEKLAQNFSITREECDQLSLSSHQKANAAYEQGLFDDEIISIDVGRGKIITKDEHLRESIAAEDLAKLRPSFDKNGVVTAGNASGIVDGAAAVLIASEQFIKEHNLAPLAEIIDGAVVGVDPSIMGIGPVPAIRELCERNGLKLDDIDLFEINEAFASQTLSCLKELKIDASKVNIWGGAIALGHPLGATGTRIGLTLARQMQLHKSQYGIASACIGGGQGISLLLKQVLN